jgi:hypothetical protein
LLPVQLPLAIIFGNQHDGDFAIAELIDVDSARHAIVDERLMVEWLPSVAAKGGGVRGVCQWLRWGITLSL